MQEYGKLLLQNGYKDNVFEAMAKKHELYFKEYLNGSEEATPYNVGESIIRELDQLFPDINKGNQE